DVAMESNNNLLFSSRRRHTISKRDWSSDVCSADLILECIIPFTIANLVNDMQAGGGMGDIARYGAQLVVMAVLSLVFGVAAGNKIGRASCRESGLVHYEGVL